VNKGKKKKKRKGKKYRQAKKGDGHLLHKNESITRKKISIMILMPSSETDKSLDIHSIHEPLKTKPRRETWLPHQGFLLKAITLETTSKNATKTVNWSCFITKH
jgi:hypothetical protein